MSCGSHWFPPSLESIDCRSGRLDIGLANNMHGSNPTSNALWPCPSAITTGRVYWETCRITSKGCMVPSVEVCAALAKCLVSSISIPAWVGVTFGNPHPEPPKLTPVHLDTGIGFSAQPWAYHIHKLNGALAWATGLQACTTGVVDYCPENEWSDSGCFGKRLWSSSIERRKRWAWETMYVHWLHPVKSYKLSICS